MIASRKFLLARFFCFSAILLFSLSALAEPGAPDSATPSPTSAQTPAATPTATPSKQDITLTNARVEAVAGDQSSIDVKDADGKSYHLLTKDMVVKDGLKQLHGGDYVTVLFSAADNSLKTFSLETVAVDKITRVWIFLASTAICFLIYWLVSGLHPFRLILGEDGRYSNSKFQIALWFAVLITSYVAMLWLRAYKLGWDFWGGIDIPQNLLLISGMSAVTFGAAKGITTAKVADAQQKGNADPKDSAHAQASLLANLTQNDGAAAAPAPQGNVGAAAQAQGARQPKAPAIDLGDFQMLVITALAVCVYVVLVFHSAAELAKSSLITLPDVDTTILATFGLGHGAYLTKKAVSNVGEG